mmetsp:Transcript_24913/g.62656  ORF Transcript_24913/g.62656 Transcript_24913/m.62656 type:complete len:232 (+) Transcript_24913:1316-2011(+)
MQRIAVHILLLFRDRRARGGGAARQRLLAWIYSIALRVAGHQAPLVLRQRHVHAGFRAEFGRVLGGQVHVEPERVLVRVFHQVLVSRVHAEATGPHLLALLGKHEVHVLHALERLDQLAGRRIHDGVQLLLHVLEHLLVPLLELGADLPRHHIVLLPQHLGHLPAEQHLVRPDAAAQQTLETPLTNLLIALHVLLDLCLVLFSLLVHAVEHLTVFTPHLRKWVGGGCALVE